MRSSGNTREQLDDVECRQARRVVERAGWSARPRREHALTGDGRVREDQRHLGVRSATSARASIGGMPRPAWIRIGTAPSRATAKIASIAAEAEPERLRPRMQLDPPRAAGEAAVRLVHRVICGIQPAERDQPAAALRGPCEHAIVRNAVGRPPFGIVQRKGARARRGPSGIEPVRAAFSASSA